MRKYYSSLLRNSILILLIIFAITSAMGQNLRKEKMAQLDFLIGDWVGVSASFENGIKKQEIPAFEKIAYQLDGHIITIDLLFATHQSKCAMVASVVVKSIKISKSSALSREVTRETPFLPMPATSPASTPTKELSATTVPAVN